MYQILFTIVLILLVTGSNGNGINWGYQYSQNINGWLKVHDVPATWFEALARCRKEGAELASPTYNEIAEAMKNEMTEKNINCGVFTDIHDSYTPGTFYTVKGYPLQDLQSIIWSDNACRATKSSLGNALIMNMDGTLDIVKNTAKYRFICTKKDNDLKDEECGTYDRGYVKNDITGSCYKFHQEGKSWPEASAVCVSEDAHLAVINSHQEADVLKEIFTHHPREKIMSQFKDSALIGFRDWGHDLGWLSLFGEKLENAGYSTWSPGQPDHSGHPNGYNIASVPFCGAIFRTAQLDDIWCDVKFAFICEKTPITKGSV